MLSGFVPLSLRTETAHRKYLPLRLLWQVELLFCLGWNKRDKLQLTDSLETAIEQLGSKALLKEEKKVGKSGFLPVLLSYYCIAVQSYPS